MIEFLTHSQNIFINIFTKDDNNHLPTIDILPCKSEMNEFLVTERMVSEQIRKLDITKSAGQITVQLYG